MAESVIQKANARLKFLYRKKDYLTQHTKQLLVMSLVQCHFDYACSVWYNGLTQSLKHKLQVTQNKLIRFILDLKPRDHVGHQQFESLNWLPVNKRVEQVMLCHVFKVKHKLAPSYMNSFLVSQNTVHSYSTRLSEKGGFNLPKAKGSGCKSFSFIGAKLWNNLPCHLTDINNFQSFKVAIKSHLLNSSTF